MAPANDFTPTDFGRASTAVALMGGRPSAKLCIGGDQGRKRMGSGT
jgi:hypothetical protein